MQELIFYPFIKWKDKQEEIYEPLIYTKDGQPKSVFWRSRSFIDMDYFTEELPMIKLNDIESHYRKYFDIQLNDSGNYPSYIYELSLTTLFNVGKTQGIISGYVPIENLAAYYSIDESERQEYFYWKMPMPFSGEVFLELPDEEKNKYGRFYGIDTYSKEYICSVLGTILVDMDLYINDKEYELCYLVVNSF